MAATAEWSDVFDFTIAPAVTADEGFGPGNDEGLIAGPTASASSLARGFVAETALGKGIYGDSEYRIRRIHSWAAAFKQWI
jgi:hypothetical protein